MWFPQCMNIYLTVHSLTARACFLEASATPTKVQGASVVMILTGNSGYTSIWCTNY